MNEWRETRKRLLQQQPHCTCDMCECDIPEETPIRAEEME